MKATLTYQRYSEDGREVSAPVVETREMSERELDILTRDMVRDEDALVTPDEGILCDGSLELIELTSEDYIEEDEDEEYDYDEDDEDDVERW